MRMRGRIKLATISISYEEKTRARIKKRIQSKPVEVLCVVAESEQKRSLKFKKRTISRVCKELSINPDKLDNVKIESIDIVKDLGGTLYDV